MCVCTCMHVSIPCVHMYVYMHVCMYVRNILWCWKRYWAAVLRWWTRWQLASSGCTWQASFLKVGMTSRVQIDSSHTHIELNEWLKLCLRPVCVWAWCMCLCMRVYVSMYSKWCLSEPASAAEKWLRARARPSESDRKDKSYTVYCLVLGT